LSIATYSLGRSADQADARRDALLLDDEVDASAPSVFRLNRKRPSPIDTSIAADRFFAANSHALGQ
jgi:hypothetical protein